MKKWAVFAAFISFRALAAQPATEPCFDIISAPVNTSTILLDRCTGRSWALVQMSPDPNGIFTFQWQVLSVSDSVLSVSTNTTRDAADRERSRQESARSSAAVPTMEFKARQAAAAEDRKVRFAPEKERLRGALGREPTDPEVDMCLLKYSTCPAPAK